jgi:hypothetical protein
LSVADTALRAIDTLSDPVATEPSFPLPGRVVLRRRD